MGSGKELGVKCTKVKSWNLTCLTNKKGLIIILASCDFVKTNITYIIRYIYYIIYNITYCIILSVLHTICI